MHRLHPAHGPHRPSPNRPQSGYWSEQYKAYPKKEQYQAGVVLSVAVRLRAGRNQHRNHAGQHTQLLKRGDGHGRKAIAQHRNGPVAVRRQEARRLGDRLAVACAQLDNDGVRQAKDRQDRLLVPLQRRQRKLVQHRYERTQKRENSAGKIVSAVPRSTRQWPRRRAATYAPQRKSRPAARRCSGTGSGR